MLPCAEQTADEGPAGPAQLLRADVRWELCCVANLILRRGTCQLDRIGDLIFG